MEPYIVVLTQEALHASLVLFILLYHSGDPSMLVAESYHKCNNRLCTVILYIYIYQSPVSRLRECSRYSMPYLCTSKVGLRNLFIFIKEKVQ